MGSSASKAQRVTGSAARKYPTRPSPATSTISQAVAPPTTTNAAPSPPPAHHHKPGPTVRPQVQASSNRSEAINLDASDPDFAQSLRTIGPVQPNPTLSPTSAFNSNRHTRGPDPRYNPALMVLEARSRLQNEAEKEFLETGRRGHEGRQFLDIHLIRQILTLRDEQKQSAGEIERRLGLKKGVVEKLGPTGVVELAQETGRAQHEIHMV